MSKDGTYGKRQRQRYRCTDPTDGRFHRFVPELPRLVVASGTCDNHVHTHQGPVALPGGLYEVREVAQALVLLAQGQTYTETARITRGRYWSVGGTGRRADSSVENGQTVADWLDQFGPVIAAGTTETEWPESIVVDSTEFQHTNPQTGRAEQLFCVLAAWGYPAGSKTGRLWADTPPVRAPPVPARSQGGARGRGALRRRARPRRRPGHTDRRRRHLRRRAHRDPAAPARTRRTGFG